MTDAAGCAIIEHQLRNVPQEQTQSMSETAEVTVGTVTAQTAKTGYKEMGLSECAKFDDETGQGSKLTGWGVICKTRYQKRQSKRGEARRKRKGVKRPDEVAAE